MDLQNAFYIIGIVYMVIMLLLTIAVLVAILIIKKKVDHVHDLVDEKVSSLRDAAAKFATLIGTVRQFMKR